VPALAEGEEEEGGAGAAEAAAPPAPVVKQAPEEGACGPQAAGGRLKVRVHTAAGESAVLRMGVNEPLSKLFAAFKQHAVQEAWMPSDALPSFWLEGERLSENATAEAAGVEDDDVLDCQW